MRFVFDGKRSDNANRRFGPEAGIGSGTPAPLGVRLSQRIWLPPVNSGAWEYPPIRVGGRDAESRYHYPPGFPGVVTIIPNYCVVLPVHRALKAARSTAVPRR